MLSLRGETATRNPVGRITLKCVLGLTLLLLGFDHAYSATELFTIYSGRAIGPVTLGMDIGELKKALGGSLAAGADQTVYTLPQQGLTVFTLYGRVTRVRTTNPNHRTEAGFGPGERDWTRVRQAACNGGLNEASAVYQVSKGFEIFCPLKGIVIEVLDGKVVGLSVIPVETLRIGARP